MKRNRRGRESREHDGLHAVRSVRRTVKPDYRNVTLRELRFDSPQANELFVDLRHHNEAFAGSTESAIRLPSADEPVSVTAGSGGMVYKAFPHGLWYGDQMSLMSGMALVLCVPLGIGAWGVSMADRSVFSVSEIGMGGSLLLALMVVLALVLVPLSIMLIASELLGYRFARSVLFDRNAERVHVLLDKSTPWRGRWHSIASFDWRCIQAEVDTMHVFTGTVGRSEIGLRCLVMDQPGGTNVVDQFSLGINMPAHHVQPILDTWEHVRRFMQHEGPLFADAEDGPNPELGTQPLWRYLWMFPELMLEGIRDFCVLAWRNKSPLALLFALGGMVVTAMLLPLLMIFGLFPWISSLAKREPTWPAEILASVGGNPLSGNDLAVWRTVVPEPTRLSPPPGLQALHR